MSKNSDNSSLERNNVESPPTNKTNMDAPTFGLSSLEWLPEAMDFFQTPSTVLLVSSIPLCLGAYYGFRQPGENLEKWVGDVPTTTGNNYNGGGDSTTQRNIARNGLAQRAMQKEAENWAARQLGFQMASKALGVATFVNLGAFSLLGAGE